MTSTQLPSQPPSAASGTQSQLQVSSGAKAKSPVRWRLVALCALLAVVGALIVATVATRAADRVSVLAVARDVPAGQKITARDVTVASIAEDPAVETVPAGQRSAVVGQRSEVDLRKGGLVSRSQLTAGGGLGDGQQLVGAELKRGQTPDAATLRPGDKVLAVTIPAQGEDVSGSSAAKDPDSVTATVVSVGQADSSGATQVNLAVSAGDGPQLASRAAAKQLALVREPRS